MANPRNLFQLEDFFRLLINGQPYYINEPEGFDKVLINLKREKDLWGLNYDFIDPETVLLFSFNGGGGGLPGGGTILYNLYQTYSSEAKATLEYGYRSLTGVEEVKYSGEVNFNDYKRKDYGVEISVEKTQFDSKLRTRYDTKVNLGATIDLDGAAIPALEPISIHLHSKRIVKYGSAGPATPWEEVTHYAATADKNGATFYFLPDTLQTLRDEVEGMINTPLVIWTEPFTDSRFQFSPTENGAAKLIFKQKFKLFTEAFSIPSGPLGNWTFAPQIVVRRAGVNILTYNDPAANRSGNSATLNASLNFDFSIQTTQELQVGDEIYFFIKFVRQFYGGNWTFLDYTGVVEVQQETRAAASAAKGFNLLDALNNAAQIITGLPNRIVSTFLGPNGPGHKYLVTNGFQIRNFEVLQRPVNVSFGELLQGAADLWDLGVQYNKDAAGRPLIRIEPASFFFRNRRIFHFANAFDYEEMHEKSAVYNEVEIGFKKYAEDEANSLDDFSTYHNYLLPITTYKSKLVKRSSFIASGYLIEQTRREQFKSNPSGSTSNDDEIFIINYADENVYIGVGYRAGTYEGKGFIVFDRELNFDIGATFTINNENSPNDAFTGTITGPHPLEKLGYLFEDIPTDEVGRSAISLSSPVPGAKVAVRSEPFRSMTGVISPDTVYNAMLSPKRLLYWYAPRLNSGMPKKDPSAVIANTYVKNNGALTTQANAANANDNAGAMQVKEGANLLLAEFMYGQALFMPETSTFKSPCRFDELMYIIECATGQSGGDEDYGVISWPDDRGNIWEGYIWDAKYSPYEEELTIIARKKRKVN